MTVDEYKSKVIDLFKCGRATEAQWQEMASVVLFASELGDGTAEIDEVILDEPPREGPAADTEPLPGRTPPDRFWCVVGPDGRPLPETTSRDKGIATWQHLRGGETWEWWEAQGWTCRQFALVPVEEPDRA